MYQVGFKKKNSELSKYYKSQSRMHHSGTNFHNPFLLNTPKYKIYEGNTILTCYLAIARYDSGRNRI